MKYLLTLVVPCLIVAACASTQTTSGAAYLQRYQHELEFEQSQRLAGDRSVTTAVTDDSGVDAETEFNRVLRKIAAVEPTLTFPARIGLARIDGGELTAVPGAEAEAWFNLRDDLGPGFGEFVLLNPMVAEMVSQQAALRGRSAARNAINKIRLGAARQHLDAVLVYETYDRYVTDKNLLAIADLTVIGAFILPSREIEIDGYATALLIDVMQGYPYGSVQVTVDRETAFTTRVGKNDRVQALADSVKTQAVIKLSTQVADMLEHLRWELAEQRATN